MLVADRNLEKLPRWARDEIARLQFNLESAEKRLREALGETPTLVEVEPHILDRTDDRRCFLPDHALVRFTTKTGIIDVHLRDGLLEVRGTGVRSAISVFPRAANVVQIAPTD